MPGAVQTPIYYIEAEIYTFFFFVFFFFFFILGLFFSFFFFFFFFFLLSHSAEVSVEHNRSQGRKSGLDWSSLPVSYGVVHWCFLFIFSRSRLDWSGAELRKHF